MQIVECPAPLHTCLRMVDWVDWPDGLLGAALWPRGSKAHVACVKQCQAVGSSVHMDRTFQGGWQLELLNKDAKRYKR